MKKTILSVMLVALVAFAMVRCGGGSSVEMSPEMTEFIGMIKGTSNDVSAALIKFGATPEVTENAMADYNLEDPKVTAKTGDCYTCEFKAGVTTQIHEICWKDGKIVSITEKQ
jgi:hypothetical protein